MDNLSEPELGRIISLSLCNGFECSFVFYGYFVSGRCVERVIEPFPFLFPGEGYLLVADGYGAAALFQVRIIEYDIQAFVDRIDFGQTQQVAGQRLDKALVILLGKVGAQGVVLLLLLRQLLFCSLF